MIRRAGFTLLEILLVASVLVVLSAVAVPPVMTLVSRQDIIRGTGEAVRFLDENRRRSVVDGVARWARLESNGRQMLSGPLGGAGDWEALLPEPLTFEEFDPAERLSGAAEEAATREQSEAAWSGIAVFYPDGGSSDLAFSIEDGRGRRREVVLRGLTGRTRLAGVGG